MPARGIGTWTLATVLATVLIIAGVCRPAEAGAVAPVATATAADGVAESMVKPLYRSRMPYGGCEKTLFTRWQTEDEKAVRTHGFASDGVVLHIAPEAGTGLVAIYHLYRPAHGDRIFTADPAERDAVLAAGWRDYGIDFYASPSTGDGLVPVHQLVKGECHGYAVGDAERQRLVADGWTYQKVAFHGRGSFSTQLVQNGDFAAGTSSWTSGGPVTLTAPDGVLRADVAAEAAEPAQAWVRQGAKTLRPKRTYTLAFDASATEQVTARVLVRENVDPYSAALDEELELGEQTQRFTYTFDSSLETSVGEVAFHLGANTAYTARIDNVTLVENQWTTSTDPMPKPEQALEAAARTRQLVEISSERGEDRQVYATPDGGLYSTGRLVPVRLKKDGEWWPVYNNLRVKNGVLSPYGSIVDLRLSPGGTGPLATLTHQGHTISLTWPTPLPAPVLETDTAVYAGVLGPDVDLRVRANAEGFSHVLVVKTAAGAADPRLAGLTLGLSAPDLTVTAGEDGSQQAVDPATGAVIFEAPKALMWDSTPPPPETAAAAKPSVSQRAVLGEGEATGPGEEGPVPPPVTEATDSGPGDASKISTVPVDITPDTLKLTPDTAMLGAADTHFPVFIDPMYRTPRSSANLMVSSTGYEAYNFKSDQGVGRCPIGLPSSGRSCGSPHKKRLFYRVPTGWLAGKQIISAEMHVREVWAASGSKRPVDAYLTKGFSSKSTWNSTSDNWLRRLDRRNVAKGWSGCANSTCPGGDVVFNVTSGVREAAAKGWRDTTFGLRAADEGDQLGWKRFDPWAWVRVHYNVPPSQPKRDQLWTEPGGACAAPENPARFNWSQPTLNAKNLVDRDTYARSAEKLKAQFVVGWTDRGGVSRTWTYLTPAKHAATSKTSNRFSVRVPAGKIPADTVISWHVRAHDGYAWGPWSSDGAASACYFVYDTVAPPLPRISSAAPDGYNEEDPANPSQLYQDGLGRYGRFTLTLDSSVTKFAYDVNREPTPAMLKARTPNSATETIQVLPRVAGSNTLYVRVADASGNFSKGSATFTFKVAEGRAPRAHWKFNDPAGATSLVDSAGGRYTGVIKGGLQVGRPGARGTAAAFNGADTDVTSSGTAVLDLTKSFSISAWAKPSSATPGNFTVVSQDGGYHSGFFLKYSKALNRWQFARNTADAESTHVVATAADAVPLDEWVHLVGVYDSVTRQIQIYVNGKAGTPAAFTSPWHAGGATVVGRAKWKGGDTDRFLGKIDDVRVYDRIISVDEAGGLSKDMLTVTHVWHMNQNGDDSGEGVRRPLRLSGRATFTPESIVVPGTVGGAAGSIALPGGSADYASIDAAVLDPRESFAISAYVQTDGTPANSMNLLSLAGTNTSALAVRYDAGKGRYVLQVRGTDSASDAGASVEHSAFHTGFGDWDHIAIVYNAREQVIELWVNGVLESAAESVSKSFLHGRKPFGPITSVRLGAGPAGAGNWVGMVDDLWITRGPADEAVIRALALPTEVSVLTEEALNDNELGDGTDRPAGTEAENVFFTLNEGQVAGTHWSGDDAINSGSRTWAELNPNLRAGAAAPIGHLTNGPSRQLFTTMADGRVISTFWSSTITTNGGWHGWFEVNPNLRAAAGATVTVITTGPSPIQIFTTTGDGRVISTFWNSTITTNGGWHDWFELNPNLRAAPGTPVQVTTTGPRQMQVFTTAADGRVISSYWDPAVTANGGWHDWFELNPSLRAAPGTPVQVTTTGPRQMQVFTTAA
ncbi:LamG-like jellyroll fold domain-containing protein, partial [Spongiactinospora sp. TRM90649]|uniref:LamG-like jellyroll fold domain-containing protein n=1 Tax=Spongiactinospora sp. TRM90649 TaxID=3031114 RepID=UPI0023F8C957